VQTRRDCVLELITLDYHQDATRACIRELSTSWLLREKSTAPEAHRLSFPRRSAGRFHHVERPDLALRQRN
jgi:hypothetical protein